MEPKSDEATGLNGEMRLNIRNNRRFFSLLLIFMVVTDDDQSNTIWNLLNKY
jgi:hypothetical protein